jgi:hypothetical protein
MKTFSLNNFCFPVIKKYIWRLKDHKPFPEYPPKWKIRKLMSKARYVAFLLGLILPAIVNAQIGGENTYEFLNLTNSARMAVWVPSGALHVWRLDMQP